MKRIAANKYENALALAESLRKNYLRSSLVQKNRAATAALPRESVWEAIAMLAG